MAADGSARWVSEGRPTRGDLAFAVLLTVWAIWKLATAATVVWTATAGGFVLFEIATGPAAATSIGAGIGSRVREIGVRGRMLVILGIAVLLSSLLAALNVPLAAAASFGRGAVLGVAIVALEGIRSRLVSASHDR